MILYLIGTLITFIAAITVFKMTEKKVTVGMLIGCIVLACVSWVGLFLLIVGGGVFLHIKAQEEGWYDIDLF